MPAVAPSLNLRHYPSPLMPIRLSFRRVCLDTRLALDISLQQLATRVGVSRSYIGRIERGEANPSLGLVQAIAEALGLELELIARPPVVFDTGTLLLIEIKTRLDDLGAVERQFAWYERSAWTLARELGWAPRQMRSWLLVLASAPARYIDYADAARRSAC